MTSIRTKLLRQVVVVLAMTTMTLALAATAGIRNAAAEPSRQVIFSGIGVANQGDFISRYGFWIWCAAEGNGPYEGACAGSVYVYRQGITVGVHGFVTEEADGTYTMHVFSNHAGVLSSTLHNVSADLVHGPRNTVEFDVTTAAGTSHGESNSSVVVVTGP